MTWFSPTRWLVVGGLVAALVVLYGQWASRLKTAAKAEVHAAWTAEKLAASEASRQREKALTIATQGVDRAFQIDKARRATAERATAERLREYQAASATSAGNEPATAPCGADAPYRAVASQCTSAIAALDGHAQAMASTASALQDYVQRVLLNPQPENTP